MRLGLHEMMDNGLSFPCIRQIIAERTMGFVMLYMICRDNKGVYQITL